MESFFGEGAPRGPVGKASKTISSWTSNPPKKAHPLGENLLCSAAEKRARYKTSDLAMTAKLRKMVMKTMMSRRLAWRR